MKDTFKRLLSLVLICALAAMLFPSAVLAADEVTEPAAGTVKATKNLVVDDNGNPVIDEDGCYTIELSVEGVPYTDEVQTGADVVLVVDNSGSMKNKAYTKICGSTDIQSEDYGYRCNACDKTYYWTKPESCTSIVKVSRMEAAQNAAKQFVSQILPEGTLNKLAVVGFAGTNGGAQDNTAVKVYSALTNATDELNSTISQMGADGGTNYTAALAKAQSILDERTDKDAKRPAYVIFISDGAPGRSGNSARDEKWNGTQQANTLQEQGVTIYAIGIGVEKDGEDALKAVASTDKNGAKRYTEVKDEDLATKLPNILEGLAAEISKTPAGKNAVLTDVVATSKFEIVEYDQNLTLASDGKTLTWAIGDIPEEKQTVTIKVKPKVDTFGADLKTNEDVSLKYTDPKTGEEKTIIKDAIGDPDVTIANPKPTEEQVEAAFKGKGEIKVACTTNSDHELQTYTELINGSFTIGEVGTDGTVTVTISPELYVKDYHTIKHTLESTRPEPLTFTLIKKDSEWALQDDNLSLDIDVACTLETTPQVAGVTKDVVTQPFTVATGDNPEPEDITGDISGVTYANSEGNFVLDAGTNSVTLLYKVTVSGDVGASYSVKDDNSTLVSKSASGMIPDSGKAYVYFTKTFTGLHAGENSLENTVTVEGTNLQETKQVSVTVENGEEPPIPAEETLIVKFEAGEGIWKIDTDPKSFTLSSLAPGKTIPAPAVIAPEGKEFDHWESRLVSKNAGFTSSYSDYSSDVIPLTSCNFVVNEEGVEVVTWTAVYKDAVPETPQKPADADLPTSYVVQCVTEGSGHESKAYDPLEGSYIIGDVIKGENGSYTCEVTILGYVYAAEYNKGTGTNHPETVNDVKYTMTWNSESKKWVAPAETDIAPIKVKCGSDAAPALTVTKSVDKTTAEVGDTLTYTITVENTGNVNLTNITVTDEMLDVKETIQSLLVDETWSKEYAYKVPSDVAGKTLLNKATVQADDDTKAESNGVETEIKKLPDTPIGPVLNIKDHTAYIIGYEDGTVRPENEISRAEVATIFFRLMTDKSRSAFWSKENEFTDVNADDWYNNAISTLNKAGIINGYDDGTFQPDASITRAEFAAIVARFSDVIFSGSSSFSDVPNSHWAARYIALAKELGWATGYPNGTYQPESPITRAEAMTMINRVLERAVEDNKMLPDMVKWSDNPTDAWYYAAVQEATNSHKYYRTTKTVKENGTQQSYCYEQWTKILAVPDWAELEKTWSQVSD